MSGVNLCQLLEHKLERLQLRRLVLGTELPISNYRIESASREITGHFNPLRSNWIEILSDQELTYLEQLPSEAQQNALDTIKSNGSVCLIVATLNRIPQFITDFATHNHFPLFSSQLPSVYLVWMIRHYLFRSLTGTTTRHGVFLDVLGVGVMITGESGVGKSELGLELIARGNGFISDDIVELHRIAPDTLDGTCPELLRDVLEVRGLGILNIRTMFGETAVRRKKSLKLIVNLHRPPGNDLSMIERLPLQPKYQEILGVSVRTVDVPVVAGRNLAVLVEAAVRNFVMQQRGIDSMQEFIQRHEQQLSSE